MPDNIQPATKPNVLSEFDSKELLRKAGIPVIETRLAHSKTEVVAISKEIGFPVVLKIASPDVIHKSDAGGVKVGLSNAAQAGRAYSEIIASVKEKLDRKSVV